MHAVVVAGDGRDGEVGEPVDLQLEGHGWLQVAVDGVLFKLWEREERGSVRREEREGEGRRMLEGGKEDEGGREGG